MNTKITPFSTADSRKAFRLSPLYTLVLSTLCMPPCVAWAAGDNASAPLTVAQVEFDPNFLSPGTADRDLSRFEKRNVILPSTYNVDFYVNKNWLGRYDIPFKEVDGAAKGSDAQACFNQKLLTQAGVDLKTLSTELLAQLAVPGACLPIGSIIDQSTSAFDFNQQRLDVTIPQISMRHTARGTVSPDVWDDGVNVGFVGYDFNLYSNRNKGQGGTQSQGYLGLNSGANLGVWHFRNNGSYSWSTQGRRQYQSIQSYVQRDVPSLTSQLTLGDSYTTGELFDSTSFRGVRLATDDRMLPDSLRGYAPTIRGVANSNAKVTVKQNGFTIYETTVAPGAFALTDLYATGYGGDLTVFVQEADGSVRSFFVPYAAVPLALRSGVNRYSVTAGTVRTPQLRTKPVFVQGTLQHGFANLTGYGGVNASTGYAAVMGGGAFNTEYGAFGVDYTQARMSLPNQHGSFTGESERFSYSKNVIETGTNLAVANYRYSSSGFFDLNTAVGARDLAEQGIGIGAVLRQRHRTQINLSQRLAENAGQLSVSASTSNYWNRSGSDLGYSVGYSNTFRNIGYTLQATRQRNVDGTMDTQYYASLSIPFGGNNFSTVNTSMTRDSSGNAQAQTSVSGTLDQNHDFFYSLAANHATGNGTNTGGSANVSYRTLYAALSASAGANTGSEQTSLGARGAVVVHPGGVTLSQSLSETFGVVQADGAEGARLINAPGVHVDSRGYAVIPSLTPYSMNTVTLDPKGTSTDVEMQITSQQVAPHAGSAVFLKFPTITGRSVMIRARQANGEGLPFAAVVIDAKSGKEVGTTGQASKIFVRGLEDKGELVVKWGEEGGSSQCRILYNLPAREKPSKNDSFQSINAVCLPVPKKDMQASDKKLSEIALKPADSAATLPLQSEKNHSQAVKPPVAQPTAALQHVGAIMAFASKAQAIVAQLRAAGAEAEVGAPSDPEEQAFSVVLFYQNTAKSYQTLIAAVDRAGLSSLISTPSAPTTTTQ